MIVNKWVQIVYYSIHKNVRLNGTVCSDITWCEVPLLENKDGRSLLGTHVLVIISIQRTEGVSWISRDAVYIKAVLHCSVSHHFSSWVARQLWLLVGDTNLSVSLTGTVHWAHVTFLQKSSFSYCRAFRVWRIFRPLSLSFVLYVFSIFLCHALSRSHPPLSVHWKEWDGPLARLFPWRPCSRARARVCTRVYASAFRLSVRHIPRLWCFGGIRGDHGFCLWIWVSTGLVCV